MAQKNIVSSLTSMLLAGAMLAIFPLKVHATDKEINGFSSYRFGMTEDEIRKLTKFDRQEIKANVQGNIVNNEKVQLTGDEPIEIAGRKYKLMLLLEEGRLNYILLENNVEYQNENVESASRSCRNAFMLRYGMLKAKYGSPDSEPETNTVEHIGIVTFAKVSIPRQSRGHYEMSRSKRLFGDAGAAPTLGPPEGGAGTRGSADPAAHPSSLVA